MGWLFGRHRKSQAEKTLEELQRGDPTGTGFDQPQSSVVPSPTGFGSPDPSAPATDLPAPSGTQSWATGFSMVVENAFSITGRGLVLTGTIDAGSVRTGQHVTVLSRQLGPSRPVEVVGIESQRKMQTTVQAGDSVGLLVRGLSRQEVNPGDLVVDPDDGRATG